MFATAFTRSRRSLIAAVVVLAAGGALTLRAQSKPLPDPCTLLTKAEIQEAIGKPVGDGTLKKNPSAAAGASCQYQIPPYGSFNLLLRPLGPGETADKVLAAFEKRKDKPAVVPNLGDKSFFLFPGYGMVQLNTVKSGVHILFTLMIPGGTEEATKTAAIAMMRKVVAKF